MNYIINPIWFYWINVADELRCIAIIAIVLSGVATLVLTFVALVNSDWKEDDEFQFAIKILKKTIVIFVISCITLVFLPSKNTLIEMQIAKYVTKENAELTIDAIKTAVDYIMQAIQGA